MFNPISKGQVLLVRALSRLLRIFALDSRSLALFRVWIAATTISDVLTRFPDTHHHYSDGGMFPREFILRSFTNYYWITLHMLSGAELVIQFLFILEIIFAFCLLIGYRTKMMNILCWLFVCSVQNRNYVLGHSGDTVHRLFLFVGILLPLSRHFSVDRALECARTDRDCDELDRDRDRERRKLGVPTSPKYEIVSFATALFVFQLLAMYFMAHHHKTGAEWTEKGIAAWMALQLDYFRTWFGDLLLISTPAVIFGNFAVLKWQYWGSLMYFIPFFNEYFKAFTCLGFFTMHVGFGMAFYLETFTWATLAACVGIIPTFVWDLATKALSKLSPFTKSITIHVTPNCKTCLAIARILDECLLPGKSKVHISSSPPSSPSSHSGMKCNDSFLGISVTDNHKSTHYGPAALGVICSHSPVLYPLHYLFKIGFVRRALTLVSRAFHSHPANSGGISDKLPYIEEGESKFAFRNSKDDEYESKLAFRPHFETFAANENSSTELTNVVVDLPSLGKKEIFVDRSQNFTLSDMKDATKIGMKVAKELCLAFLLFLVLSCNAGNLNSSYGVPPALQPVLWVFQLDQYWGMFAPRPPDITWWYNFEGYLDDGTHAELFNNGALHTFTPNIPHTFDKPNVHDSIGNHRWFKLFENGLNSHSQREEIRLYFGRWFCREYNQRHPENRVHKYSIHFMYERLNMELMDGSRYPPARETIWNHLCYEK